MDGSEAYIGYSNCGTCRSICPGRIDIVTKAGYASCKTNYIKDTTTAYYLLNHPSLYYVGVRLANATTVTNRLAYENLFYGRIELTDSTGKKYIQPGKVNMAFGLFYWNGKTEVSSNSWDLLSC